MIGTNEQDPKPSAPRDDATASLAQALVRPKKPRHWRRLHGPAPPGCAVKRWPW